MDFEQLLAGSTETFSLGVCPGAVFQRRDTLHFLKKKLLIVVAHDDFVGCLLTPEAYQK
ncbi:MAG: hypothetical protein ACR2PT_05465 [Endozoicomonas sp.]